MKPLNRQSESAWKLVYNSYEPSHERLRESMLTVGNGYFATRGALSESNADGIHYPGTYLAGGYNRLISSINGDTVENEDLVNLPNWLCLTFRIEEGDWFSLDTVEVLSYRAALNLKNGLLERYLRFRDGEGRITTLHERRLVHMENMHLGALEYRLTAENWSGALTVRTALDGRVANTNVLRYKGLASHHLEPVESRCFEEEFLFLKVETNQSEIRVAQTARTRVFRNGQSVPAVRIEHVEPGYVAQDISLTVNEGDMVLVEKVMAMVTSRDEAISECGLESRKQAVFAPGFVQLNALQRKCWRILWKNFDIGLEVADGEEQKWHPLMILRLHVFHLIQTVSQNTIGRDVGVPARGWHGEAYRGHIFWDELFILPFLNFRMPEISRSLLMYRYRRLDEARLRARLAGFKGAMYPWQSGSDGREETPAFLYNPLTGLWKPDHTHLQYHINAAVAFNIWRYYQTTEDMEFLMTYGAEVILETARFWATLATYNPALERYEIRHVVGPDEFHDGYPGIMERGVHNNAYTNIMAVWTLVCALRALEVLPQERRHTLKELLNLRDEELLLWERVSRQMRVVIRDDGIIEQFEGYDQLKELDWEAYERQYGDLQRLDQILEAEGESPNAYKLSKQADVLMLFYLFSSEELSDLFERMGYGFDPAWIPKNIEYYLKRTSHGSTLSRVVHAWVLSRADRKRSWDLFTEALESDIADIQCGTTPEGIHLGAMAGTVDIIQRCYTGIVTRGDVLWLNPSLPERMERLHFRIRYRGQPLDVVVRKETIHITVGHSMAHAIRIGIKDQVYMLGPGDTREFHYIPKTRDDVVITGGHST